MMSRLYHYCEQETLKDGAYSSNRRNDLPLWLVLILAAACLLWGADSRAGAFLMSGLILCFGAPIILLADRKTVWPSGLFVGVTIILLISLALAFSDGNTSILHPEYWVLAAGLTCFLVGRITALQGRVKWAWALFLSLGLLYAIWTIIAMQFDTGLLFGVKRAYGQTGRLVGSFLSANTAATLLGMIALSALVSLLNISWQTRSSRPRHWLVGGASWYVSCVCGLALPLALIALLMTGSRGGVLFFLLIAGACILLYLYKRLTPIPILIVTVLLSCLAAGLAGQSVWKRMVSLETAFETRSQLFSLWWQASLQKPVTGYGLGGFAQARQAVMTSDNALLLDTQGAAHNVFLHWLIQAGWLGAACMWLLIMIVLLDIMASRTHLGLCRAVLAVSAFIILHGTLDYALEIPGLVWWWSWLLGLAHGAAQSDLRGNMMSRKYN